MTNDFEIQKICDPKFQISFILNKLNIIFFWIAIVAKKNPYTEHRNPKNPYTEHK
jgi:hypothetical protein